MEDERADRMESKGEGRRNAEVAATPTHGPEEIWVVALARYPPLAVGRNQFDCQKVVDGHAVLAAQPAVAATEREARHACHGNHTNWRGKCERLSLPVEIAQCC